MRLSYRLVAATLLALGVGCSSTSSEEPPASEATEGAEAPQPELPPVFAAMLAECLERPITADWAQLGQFWAGASHAPAQRLN